MSEPKQVRVPVRVWNLMQSQDIKSLEGFQNYTRMEILRYPGIGRGTLIQLEKLLEEHGLDFKPDAPRRYLMVPVYESQGD
jgi:hypothetical protein